MSPLLHCFLGCHGNQIYLTVLVGNQNHNASGKFCLQIIAKAAQLIHVYTRYVGAKERNTLDFLYIVHDIAKRSLCFLRLHGFILGFYFLQFLLQSTDSLRKCGRRSLDKLCRLVQLCFQPFIIFPDIVSRQCFDSPDSGCNTVLGKDLKRADPDRI